MFDATPLFHQRGAEFLLLTEWEIMAGPPQDYHGRYLPPSQSFHKRTSVWCSWWGFSPLNYQAALILDQLTPFNNGSLSALNCCSQFLIVVWGGAKCEQTHLVFRDGMRHVCFELDSPFWLRPLLPIMFCSFYYLRIHPLCPLHPPLMNSLHKSSQILHPNRQPSCSWPGSGPRITRRRTIVRIRFRRSSRSKSSF